MKAKTNVFRQHGSLHHVRRSVALLLGFYNVSLHSGIARYAREADWVLDDSYVRVGLPPVGWQGDGIITLITNPKDVVALRQLPSLPLVDLSKGWISNSMPEKYRASGHGRPRVYYDNILIGQLAAQHFLERGFKHVAYMNCGNYWLDVERIPSIRRIVEASGGKFYEIEYYKCFESVISDPLTIHRAAHQWLIKTLRYLPKPLGVAVSADDMAVRLLRACDDACLGVPEQVAVLGCDNDPLVCDYAPVPLSSIDNDWDGIGYAGAKLLDSIMDGKRPPYDPILVPPKRVVARLSTEILAVPDIKVARAVRYILEHYQEAIGTQEIASAAGLNRRKLERDFRKYLGRSIGEEILQRRIECAKKLLLETRMKAHEIAHRSGFSGIVHFSKAFLRASGSRPSHFRRKYQITSNMSKLNSNC